MALHSIENNGIRSLQPVTFEQVRLKERGDLQRLFRDQIEIVVEDGMVLAEEFGSWEDSSRRIDLLALDKDANLVVVELKRTDSGGHMELQALRYAAMVSTMTFAQAVEAHEEYLHQRGSSVNAREAILEFLGWEEEAERRFAEVVRIVLVSADFSKEITTTALWLNEQGLDIRCVRLKPYEMNSRVILDVQQLIPLPEAQDYTIQVGLKQRSERAPTNRRWNLESFIADTRKHCGDEIAQLARSIYESSVAEFGYVRFSGNTSPRFGPTFSLDGIGARAFIIKSHGQITFRFVEWKPMPWGKNRVIGKGFLERLNKIPGIDLSEEDLGRKPSRPLELLLDPTNFKFFKDAVSWLKHTVALSEKQPD
ncbi:MAG: hypothetical protein OEU68_03565 [Nitrospira sp.]|nr:hypothetical protein [Nitrospira sp.]MDH4244917.1 hypothetical protein [Nitrospira sp.]MDH4354812.1 hypothetical protein [Nitrospira sp.]MDH5317115.1 hypothetical protein [Nitrospira sp.]